MAFSVFINFDGNCREAVEYYAKVFDCPTPKFMTYGDIIPGPDVPAFPEEAKNLIMYSDLMIAGVNIMFSDAGPFIKHLPGNNINLTVGGTDKAELTKWFNGLKADAKEVHMELQQTFWSDLYGMLVDKYGIPWQFSHDSGKQFQSLCLDEIANNRFS